MATALGKKFYKQIIDDDDVEDNLVFYMYVLMEAGFNVSLINDDNGHWAIAENGIHNCPDSAVEWIDGRPVPLDVTTTFFIEKADFADSIGEALRIYARKQLRGKRRS